jgi:tricorn protease
MTRSFPTPGLERLALGLAAVLLAVTAHAEPAADRTLMRYPTLNGNTIVFVAHDNLWAVPRTGGTASRLTADEGRDVMPRFSPDGRWIAFTGEYQGNRDVYVMPAGGGTAKRITFTSDLVPEPSARSGPNNMVVTWTPDSKSVVFLSRRMAWNSWINRLFTVPVTGGMAQLMPLDRGGFLSYSPDGKQIALNRIFRNFRTWKRYDGGLAQDIDSYDFDSRKLTHVTDWPGTETFPMWSGKTIYFMSDHDSSRRENIWAYDTDSHEFRQITHYTDYDIDFPSLGAGAGAAGIVFQQGGKLHVLDIPSEQVHDLDVTVPDDGTRTGPRWVDAKSLIREQDAGQHTDYDLAPNGGRIAVSARGDVFTLPAEHGNTRNLTQTSNADEDHPSWSPDGKTVAYTTDVSGEQQIAVRSAEGGVERILTHFPHGYFYSPRWSPGGDRLAFSDNEHRLWVVATAGGADPQQLAQDPYQEIQNYTWAPDGRWLAYVLTGANQQSGIWLYNLETHKATRVSEPRSNDFNPGFDAAGRYLYFISTRHENPTLSHSEFNIATLKMAGIYVATLKKDAPSPFAPRSDEGAVGAPEQAAEQGQGVKKDQSAKKGKDGAAAAAKDGKPGVSKPLQIDLEGLTDRAVPLPIAPAEIASLDVRDDKVFYLTGPSQMLDGPLPGEKPALRVYDMKERKDAAVVEGLSTYVLSADGKKVAYKIDNDYFIADAKAGDGKGDDESKKKLDLGHLRVRVEPTQEWAEMFNSAWRLERDFFFQKEMNGNNWDAVRAAYAPLLPLAGSRGDVNYLIGEMLGEISNSHTYVGGGDAPPDEQRVPTAYLGADFALDSASGRYRLATIYPGDNTRDRYRSPLTAPGLDVHAGQYLLAIDGVELKDPADPYSLLVGKQDGTVKLTIADSPNGARRDVVVQPVKSELALREQAWIDHNREVVDKASGGRIAYVYLSDMESLGMEQFIRQFYGQLDKQALLVDERWNGGGFIDQILLERLRRMLVGLSVDRERTPGTIPQQLIVGPKACLLNHYSGSDGDIFPFYFRKYGLGPLIGTRSWGGVRGIRGEWPLLDGGYITIPEDGLYGLDSQWVLENRGVEPDMPVDDSPADWAAGHDVQLEAGVSYLMEELQKHPGGLPPPPPALPAYPPPGAKQGL